RAGGDAGHDDPARPHPAVPGRGAGTAAAFPRRDRAAGGELHGMHAVRPRVPGLVHLHRLPQGDRGGARCGPAPAAQRAGPVRDRLLALHVLRHLRRGVPVRRAVLVAGVRVRRVRHPRPAARAGPPRGVDGHGTAATGARPERRTGQGGGRRAEGSRDGDGRMTVADVRRLGLGAVAVGAGFLVVTTPHLVRAGLYLVVSLGAVAGMYLVLTAELVAWVQVLIYVGAVVVLLLFAVMLTRAPTGPSDDLDRPHTGRV